MKKTQLQKSHATVPLMDSEVAMVNTEKRPLPSLQYLPNMVRVGTLYNSGESSRWSFLFTYSPLAERKG